MSIEHALTWHHPFNINFTWLSNSSSSNYFIISKVEDGQKTIFWTRVKAAINDALLFLAAMFEYRRLFRAMHFSFALYVS